MRIILILVALSCFDCKNSIKIDINTDVDILDTISYKRLLEVSKEYLIRKTDSLNNEYGFMSYLRRDYNQKNGQIVYHHKGVKAIVVDCVSVGNFSEIPGTWEWSWSIPSNNTRETTELEKVRSYGVERSFKKLTRASWPATEREGWEMTMIACYILRANGATRISGDDKGKYSFKIFKTFRLIDSSHLNWNKVKFIK